MKISSASEEIFLASAASGTERERVLHGNCFGSRFEKVKCGSHTKALQNPLA
ncbi:MAG: hypothetical protein PUK75_03125 [bacterium]|nr:hypothetical protein [bacterium]MDY4099374.1 hypothetical protein [Lachnospiraceae bacterium]